MRYLFLFLASMLFAPAAVAGEPEASKEPVRMTVYKTPTCGCCAAWVDYLRERNFEIAVIDRPDLRAVKERYGISPHVQSCHTGVVDGYAIEGHVPVEDILRLLRERPAVAGLSAPGMPRYSPGMMSIVPRDYDVVTFTRSGETEIFSSY